MLNVQCSMENKFKNKYTDAERDECIKWFDARMDRIPATLENTVIKGFTITDLQHTVKWFVKILRKSDLSTSVYCGFFAILLRLRQAILAEHPELETV